ncbi:hypothetical protein [Oceanobacillus sp. AG]|uniref:hypothetical protein n=1 Tax=Oceanobacillus sp. AG TaxID=2681969 RepID=UPI0012EBF3E0|nr:hypothetical protein [Oceanobacillus sp. AG]
MKIQKVYKKGDSQINEDSCVVNEAAQVFAAIDGATGLFGAPGYLASQTLQEGLSKMTESSSLYQSIQQANERLGTKMVDYYETNIGKLASPVITEIPKSQRSTAGIAAVKIHPERKNLEYVHAGDCMLFLRYKTGEIRSVTYDGIHYFDDLAIKEMVRLREEDPPISQQEIQQSVNAILLSNKEKLNTNEGYGIIDGSEEALEYISYGRLPLHKVTDLLLVSDGLLLPTDGTETDIWMETAKLVFEHGLHSLVAAVERREEWDADCEMYPRFKQRDDKTGILLKFE